MPDYPGFVGPSYLSQSPMADCERLINWYVEPLESPFGRSRAALYPTPGFMTFVDAASGITDIGCRAGFSENGRCFAVIGTGFYELFSDQSVTRRGTVAQDANPATIASNGAAGGQLLITSGGNAYSYVLASNDLQIIADLTGLATMGGMVDGYGLVFNASNSTVYVSDLNDVTSWTIGTNYFQRSILPDPWKAMVIRRSEIILVGEKTGEVWRDVNAGIGQPFAPDLGAVFTYGTTSPWSVKVSGDLTLWLAQTDAGPGTVVAMRGYVPQKISNYGVDTAISRYISDVGIGDAETLIYTDQGHSFGIVRFPRANATWGFDIASSFWHERGAWNSQAGHFDIWRPRVIWPAFGKLLAGEASTGTIAMLDVSSGLDMDGSPIRRVRVAPPLFGVDGKRFWVDRFELGVQPGTTTSQTLDPQVMLRISKDYGITWGNERWRSGGLIGQFGRRVYWQRNGSSLDSWVPEIVVTDNTPWRIVDATVNGRGIANFSRAA